MSATKITDPDTLRKLWFDQPLDVVEHGGNIPDGNGALIALMAVFPLYERFIEDKAGTKPADKSEFRAQDLNLPKDDADQFWNVFRDGLGHSAMFFEESRTARREGWKLPKVNLDGKHPPLPVYGKTKSGERVICLNPWGFVKHVLDKYRTDPDLFTRNSESPMLSLQVIPVEEVM